MTRGFSIATVMALVWAMMAVFALPSGARAAGGDAASGASVYKSNCGACHGPAGEGDGPIAAALTPRPANFASEISRQKSEDELLAIIRDGVPNSSMPAYQEALSGAQLQDVLAFVLTLRAAKSETATTSAAGTIAVARQTASAPAKRPPAGVAAGGGPADGGIIYGNTCTFCHDAKVGPVLRGRKLHPAYVQFVVRNGLAAMPAFRSSEIDDGGLAALADYVATLPGGTNR